jgi:hypothetical protein
MANGNKLMANKYGALLAVILLSTQQASAFDPLSTKELAEHCSAYEKDPEGVDATFCVHYVQGFIDGAIATDEMVMNNVVAEYQQEETFTERALRTRSPSRQPSPSDASHYAEFCLGTQVPLQEVVEHVIEDLMNRTVVEATLLARDAVYAVLRRDYACEIQDSK